VRGDDRPAAGILDREIGGAEARPFKRKLTDGFAIAIVILADSVGCRRKMVSPAATFQPPLQVPALVIVTIVLRFTLRFSRR
jgi:hypothetical protein